MVHVLFRAVRSRHPLARLAMGVLGILVVALFVTVGVFALGALAIGGALLLLVNALRAPRRPPASAGPGTPAQPTPPGVIEGEFTVVSVKPAAHEPSTAPR